MRLSKCTGTIRVEPLERRLFLDASQLTVALDSSTLPAAVSDHATLTGKVAATVSNNSGILQKERVVVSALIANGPLDVAARNFGVLKSTNLLLTLADGASQTFNLTVNIPRGKLADGIDTIYAVVVDPTNAFAQSQPGPTLTVHPPIVTLSESENILKLPDSTTAGVKFSVVDQVSITNSGTDASSGPLKIGIYATPDGVPADGSLMTGVTRAVVINPGKTVTVPVTVGGIPKLSTGTYKLVTQVTESNGKVTATDPSAAPSITVTAPTTGIAFSDTISTDTPTYSYEPLDGALQFLSSLQLTMSIKNTGSAATGEDGFNLFASASPTFDSSAVQIGGPLSLNLGLIPHNGLRNFNVKFNTTADLNDFSGSEIDRYIFVQVTDPTGNLTVASLGNLLKVAGPVS